MPLVAAAAPNPMNYPTQKAVAYRLIYRTGWKCGESPERIKLGSLPFPIGEGIEFADALLRRAFPTATDSRLYDERGQWFCSGSLS